MRSQSRAEPADAGAVTAELAVALPAVIVVLAAALAGLHAGAAQVRAVATAGTVARAEARGDPAADVQAALGADPGAAAATSSRGDLVCVTVREPAVIVPVAATACALRSTP